MSAGRWLLFAGGLVLAAGLLVGFIPVSSSGASCGSAFVASDDATVADYTTVLSGGSLADATAADACDSLRSVVRIPAIVLLVAGVGLGMVGMARETRAEATTRATATGGDQPAG